MKHEWLKIEARLARPGAERDLEQRATATFAAIDTGAEITVVPRELAERVYDGEPLLTTSLRVVAHVGGSTEIAAVPLLIGLTTTGGELVHAQVECLLGPVDCVLLGSDVLSLLGLELRIDYKRRLVQLERYTWEQFEDEVAAMYRSLGARVRQNLNLGGFQVDIVAEEGTQSGQRLRLLVECKFYRDRAGNRVINDFARVVATLKAADLVDRGVLVSHRGFTQDATLVAKIAGIELLTLDDLRQRISVSQRRVLTQPKEPEESPPSELKGTGPRVFVAMPFAPELDDVYHLGIRETVQHAGGACERADEIQHTGGILEKIYASIRGATVVIAEVSYPNPNVFYEVGFAHALAKPVVLLTRDVSSSPFDLRGYNHIVYKSIVDLRRSLASMLSEILKS